MVSGRRAATRGPAGEIQGGGQPLEGWRTATGGATGGDPGRREWTSGLQAGRTEVRRDGRDRGHRRR
jgi:hypothetical protein